MEKVEYIRCPRCELNYILKKDKLCKVCQTEVSQLGRNNELDNMQICPICNANYISDNEDMCSYCAEEKSYDDNLAGNLDKEENWRMYVENDDFESEEDEIGEMCAITENPDEDEIEASELDLGDLSEDEEEIDLSDIGDMDELDDLDDLDEDFDEDEELDDEDDDF